MANHRMFSKEVIASDNFFDLPPLAQVLYIHIGLNADDYGFTDMVRSIQRQVGASKNDLQKLIDAGFIYVFDSGVAVDLFWNVNNWIRKDRRKPTANKKELECLQLVDDGRYIVQPNDNQVTTICQPKISKEKISKDNNIYIYNNNYSESTSSEPVDNVDNSNKSVDNSKTTHDENAQQGPDNLQPPSLDGVDVYELTSRDAFEMFRQKYPRRQGALRDVQTAWVIATVTDHIIPGDLVRAAERYAEECKANGTEQKYIKMPQNFISSGTWKQYAPKYLPSCPQCHGQGVYEDNGMVLCDCDRRYG